MVSLDVLSSQHPVPHGSFSLLKAKAIPCPPTRGKTILQSLFMLNPVPGKSVTPALLANPSSILLRNHIILRNPVKSTDASGPWAEVLRCGTARAAGSYRLASSCNPTSPRRLTSCSRSLPGAKEVCGNGCAATEAWAVVHVLIALDRAVEKWTKPVTC